jgi:peptidoglycan/LPS O-acetylase OafA/YrhL
MRSDAGLPHLAYLDGWRALAITGVLIDHYLTAQFLNLGRFGVEMFFVLSGMLMADILFVRRLALPEFFTRRFSRVLPALLLFLAAMTVAWLCGVFKLSWPQLLAAGTLTYNYYLVWGSGTFTIDHLWTLCVEEHSYLLLAMLAWLVRRSERWGGVVCLTLAAVAWTNGMVQTLLGSGYYDVYWRTDVRAASILMSAGIYLLCRTRQVPSWLPPVLALVALGLSINVVPDPIKYGLGTVALAVALVFFAQSPPLLLRALGASPLRALGLVSFSLYLWQQPFAQLFSGWWRVLGLGLALTIATASFLVVERPSRAFLNRWIGEIVQRRRRIA